MQTLEHESSNSSSDSIETAPIRFNAGCILNTLSGAQQEQLFDWLELYSARIVLEMVAAPAPESFWAQNAFDDTAPISSRRSHSFFELWTQDSGHKKFKPF